MATPQVFDHPLDWMPVVRYRHLWPDMKAFAIPAYNDARIRVNLKGRESRGRVSRRGYQRTLAEICALLGACVDMSGRPLDMEIEFTNSKDPLRMSDWQTDIVVRLNQNVLGFSHPRLGTIGPVPHRRTGGHTGGYGGAYLTGHGVEPGYYGVRSTFDVVPMIRDFVGRRRRTAL